MRSDNVYFVSIVGLCKKNITAFVEKKEIVMLTVLTQFSPQAGRLSSFLASATSCDVAINNGRKVSFPQP